MAKSTSTSAEFIQKSFSPLIAVLSSSQVDEICQKNHLSFIELLEPFCTFSKDVCYKEPSGNVISVKNLQIVLCDVNLKPPEPAVARRFLNESVTSTCDEVEPVEIKSGNVTVQIPSVVPWFEKWRTTFLKVQFPSDHEFTKHYIACMIVISSQDDNPMDMLSNKVQQLQQMLSMSPPKMMPKWFSSSVLRYYVLLHDTLAGDLIKAEKVYEEMKSTYNTNCCYMLKINSQSKGKSVIDLGSYWKRLCESKEEIQDLYNASMTNSVTSLLGDQPKIETAEEVAEESKSSFLIHPLSPQLESQRIFNDGTELNGMVDDVSSQFTETCLSVEDVEHIKTLVSNFILNALLPFVETQMQYLNEMVFNKKGVSKSLFSVPRRWFGGPKPGSPVSVPNAHYYHPDSPELQMRRLGDICFMFGAYNCAFQAYHSVKRDFNNDGAWLYYAGALEMAALSAFLIGQDLKKAQEYTDESVTTYLQVCRMPQFATRLTLCASECLKNLHMYGEAAGKLLQMTSEESDLRSALLLEEASYCFVKSRKPPMPRKYAFHLVLAGHRFAKANQKKHSLRCYRQAYQVYRKNDWGLAEDHIHFTIGKLASALKQKEITATEFAKLFTRPSSQLPAQQAIFLKEYFLSLIELQKENGENTPFLEVPRINHSSIRVALNSLENVKMVDDYILAGKHMSEEELADTRWGLLEKKLYHFANTSSTPFSFKPTINIFSSNTNNSVQPTCVIGEQIRTSVDVVNILNIPLSLKKVELMWMHSSLTVDPSLDKNKLAETEIIESVSLDPDSTSKISLHITPKTDGKLHITGIVYTVVLPPASDGAEPLAITGHTLFAPQGMRVVSTKDQKTVPVYLPDFRLQLEAVSDAPRLKVFFKNIPSEMLCGEVKEISVKLINEGSLPIDTVLFTSSESNCFSVPQCTVRNNIFSLSKKPILPGHYVEVTIFLRGCDKSGRVSVDLLFYCGSDNSSQHKLKYRLIHHTLHLLIHESIYASASVSRSIKLVGDDVESINIKMQVQNKNQFYDSVNFILYLHHISLFSSHWKLYDVIFPSKGVAISLEQEQAVFITFKAKRECKDDSFSDLVLGANTNSVSPLEKPYSDFTQFVINEIIETDDHVKQDEKNSIKLKNMELAVSRVIKTDEHIMENEKNKIKVKKNMESAVTLNSLLTLFWKAEFRNTGNFVYGQHHVPLTKMRHKYTSDMNGVKDIQKLNGIITEPNYPFFGNLYCNEPAAKELVLIRMKHPAFVKHSFSSKRICSVTVVVLIQNCCDGAVEVKLDTTYQTNANISKLNELSSFLWMGLVLHTFSLKAHSCIEIPLSVCFGNSGTYDLTSQFSVSARNDDTQVFVPQTLVSHSLLCITNEVL